MQCPQRFAPWQKKWKAQLPAACCSINPSSIVGGRISCSKSQALRVSPHIALSHTILCTRLQKRFAELEAAKLLDTKAAKADGDTVLDAKPLQPPVY